MLHVLRSNSTERLARALADALRTPLAGGPFRKEVVVVQGRGMERWLAQQLATDLGICANTEFIFPRGLVERLIDALDPDERAKETLAAYQTKRLAWTIAQLLPALAEGPGFEAVAHYLWPGGRPEGGSVASRRSSEIDRRLALAERIADVFDRYLIHRPDMLMAWQAGREGVGDTTLTPDDRWQPVLWRALVEVLGEPHLAARLRRAGERARALDAQAIAAKLRPFVPERVHVFGLSTLPPFWLDLLDAVGSGLDVHLHLLSPSREYWAEIRSQREQLRQGAVVDELLEGHPLLASLGRLGRDFQWLLEDRVAYVDGQQDLYVDPLARCDTILRRLQADLLDLRTGPAERPLDPQDDSIRVHVCHGRMREVEVVHDQLLDAFERDPTLSPDDVIVMAPDIEAYAPFVEAVFGARQGLVDAIPYRIADRRPHREREVSLAFSRVLEAVAGRLSLRDVLDLLGRGCVRERFGIEEADVGRLQDWIIEAGVRWGEDAAQRVEAGLPEDPKNTWAFGLERLLLGYAGGDADGVFCERRTLPLGALADPALLGRLIELCEVLFAVRSVLRVPKPVGAWCEQAAGWLARLVARDDENGHEHQRLRELLASLGEDASQAGFEEAIDFAPFHARVRRLLDADPAAAGFLSGGVTFCRLVPMRSIPFRMVCVLGLSDGEFPRTSRPPSFDVIASAPRPGDRSDAQDDRYLFLEAILSARDRLLLSYVGRDAREGSEEPPSIVLAELVDAIETTQQLSDETVVRDWLRIEHPLQPFDPRYFGGDGSGRLKGFDPVACEGARALVARSGEPVPFVDAPLVLPSPTERVLSLGAFERFLRQPGVYYLKDVLGIRYASDEDELDVHEPLEISGLDRFRIGDELLARLTTEGVGFEETVARVVAQGVLPGGALGRVAVDDVLLEARALAHAIESIADGARLESRPFSIEVDGTRIEGEITGLVPRGQLHWRLSKPGGPWELSVWLRHLLIDVALPEHGGRQTVFLGRPERTGGRAQGFFFAEVEDAEAQLARLCDAFWRGQTLPLPLFPRTSRAYAEIFDKAARKDAEPDPEELEATATRRANETWLGGDFDASVQAERESDPGLRLLWQDVTPIERSARLPGGEDFRRWALGVFAPMLAAREVLE